MACDARQPNWTDRLPYCSEDECCQYDGKRCRLYGFRPGRFCEPELLEIVGQAVRLREQLDEAWEQSAGETLKLVDTRLEVKDLKSRLAEAERELSLAHKMLAATNEALGDELGSVAERAQRLRSDNDRLRGEVERLRLDADMACIEPRDDCDCAGCLCAAEYHQRTPTDAEPEDGEQDDNQDAEE